MPLEKPSFENTPPPARHFGILWAVIFFLIGSYPLLQGGPMPFLWSYALSGLFIAISLIRPSLLNGINILWFRLGMALGFVMSHIIMACVYVVTLLPISIIMRMTRHDALQLRKDPDATSYWLSRETKPYSMKRQF